MIAPPQHVSEDWDVLVIGAGPAGTAAAAIIAEHGHRVLIVERDAFPRYRLGESLIPYCWHALNRLGMVEKLDAAACTVKKHSVQFVGLEGGTPTPFYFNQHTDEDLARTWQVVRSEFDRMMLDTALGRGAQVAFRATARELIRDGETVVGRIRSSRRSRCGPTSAARSATPASTRGRPRSPTCRTRGGSGTSRSRTTR
jgi:flavin-dependent dehydrogenase